MRGLPLDARCYALQQHDKLAFETVRLMDQLERVMHEEYQAAFNDLRSVWLFSPGELDALLSTTVNQRTTVAERFGESLAYAFVRQETLAGSLLRLTYVELTERHALRWVFLFYKPGDTWTLNSVMWDDDVDALFKE